MDQPRRKNHPAQGKPVDIYAVAKRARVSTATVSRTINGASTVDAKLAGRVWKAVRELNYQPKMHARALGSGRTRLVGLIVTDITNPFFPDMIRGFELAAVTHGYEILIGSLDKDPESVAHCVDRMIERSVDGIAALTFGIEQAILDQLRGRTLPLVFVDFDPSCPNVMSLKVDYSHGIRQAVQHLAALGHRDLAFISGQLDLHVARVRLDAFLAAIKEIGVKVKQEWICEGDFTLEGGIRMMEGLLKHAQRPTAVMCSNDMSAIGAMHAVHDKQLSIPGDLSIVGFDNIHIAAYTYPPLTTVEMSGNELALCAVQALISMMDGKESSARLEVSTQLVVRQSSGVARANRSR